MILRQEVIVRFVDIDGIVEHYCLIFFLHISISPTTTIQTRSNLKLFNIEMMTAANENL